MSESFVEWPLMLPSTCKWTENIIQKLVDKIWLVIIRYDSIFGHNSSRGGLGLVKSFWINSRIIVANEKVSTAFFPIVFWFCNLFLIFFEFWSSTCLFYYYTLHLNIQTHEKRHFVILCTQEMRWPCWTLKKLKQHFVTNRSNRYLYENDTVRF